VPELVTLTEIALLIKVNENKTKNKGKKELS